MKYSVMMPFVPKVAEQVIPFAALVRHSPAVRLWQGQSLCVDSHQQFSFVAGGGLRVPAGVGVSLMPLRHPWEAALQARSLAAVTGESFVAGFGPGATAFQHFLLGAPYASQIGAVREYTTVVKAILGRGHIDLAEHNRSAKYFPCHMSLPDLEAPPIEVGLGVLRPRMAELAGEIADVAISWLTPAQYIADVIVPAMEVGARRAGRDRPRIVAMVPITRARKGRSSAEIAVAGSANHLRGAHYIDMLAKSGITIAGASLLADAQAAIDGGAILTEECFHAELAAFEKAGVDEVVLNVSGVCALYGPQGALRELELLVSELH